MALEHRPHLPPRWAAARKLKNRRWCSAAAETLSCCASRVVEAPPAGLHKQTSAARRRNAGLVEVTGGSTPETCGRPRAHRFARSAAFGGAPRRRPAGRTDAGLAVAMVAPLRLALLGAVAGCASPGSSLPAARRSSRGRRVAVAGRPGTAPTSPVDSRRATSRRLRSARVGACDYKPGSSRPALEVRLRLAPATRSVSTGTGGATARFAVEVLSTRLFALGFRRSRLPGACPLPRLPERALEASARAEERRRGGVRDGGDRAEAARPAHGDPA